MEDIIIKLACVGDSITYGQTLRDRESECYPAVLERMLFEREGLGGKEPVHYEVGNLGVSGSGLWRKGSFRYVTTPEYSRAVRWGADILVICLGTNDAVHQINSAFEKEFVEDYLALIDSLKMNSPLAKVFIAKLPPIPCYPDLVVSVGKLNVAIARVADLSGATLIDFSAPFHGRDDLFTDGVHPNKEGARELAKVVYGALFDEKDMPESCFGIEALPDEYTAEDLLSIDEERSVRDEREAVHLIDTFWRVMEKPRIGAPPVDPNDLRTLFRKRRELLLLPTVRDRDEEDLARRVISAVREKAGKGDAVLLTFATTEDDWRLEGIQYESVNEIITDALGDEYRLLFGSAIPKEGLPYLRPVQMSVMIIPADRNMC